MCKAYRQRSLGARIKLMILEFKLNNLNSIIKSKALLPFNLINNILYKKLTIVNFYPIWDLNPY